MYAAGGLLAPSDEYRAYDNPPVRSFMSTLVKLLTELGLTQASIVMAFVRSSVFASLTVTQSLTPLNERALPYLPEVVQVAPEMAPLFALPDESVALGPLPALKLHAPTSPVVEVAASFTGTVTPADAASRLALSSTARLRMVTG